MAAGRPRATCGRSCARAVRTGIVERAVYDVRDGSDEIELSAKLGLALGVDANEVDVDRRLVAASAWTQGSRERERADCGVTTAARLTYL